MIIAAETAYDQRAFWLHSSAVAGRQNRRLVNVITKGRSSAAALPMEMESRLRSLLHGTMVVAVKSAKQHHLSNEGQACRLPAALAHAPGSVSRAYSVDVAHGRCDYKDGDEGKVSRRAGVGAAKGAEAAAAAGGAWCVERGGLPRRDGAVAPETACEQRACRLHSSAVAGRQNRRHVKAITKGR